MQISNWLTDLATTPADFKHNFVKKFSNGSIKEIWIYDLIDIFGRSNLAKLEGLLPQFVNDKIKEKLNVQSVRFEKILKIAFKDIIDNKPLDLKSLGVFYQISILEGETMKEMAIKEMAKYLSTLSMPFQESHYWKCYQIPAIAQTMDTYRAKLENAVEVLFQKTKSQEEMEPFNLTFEQELILSRCPAVKGHGSVVSFMHLFYGWTDRSLDGSHFIKEIESNLYFDKLLLGPKKENFSKLKLRKLDEANEKPQICFRNFFVKQTFYILFEHPDSLLPLPSIKNELALLFSQSIPSQQDILFYIGYLHTLIKKDRESFNFKEALSLLQSLVIDRTTLLYSFLHSSLQFFHFVSKFPIEKDNASFVFEAIYAIKQREHYDTWIYEKAGRKPFNFNSKFMSFVKEKDFPKEEVGRIILKFLMTVYKLDLDSILFISLDEHIEYLENTKEVFGIDPPLEIAINILLFQSITPSAIKIFNELAQIRLDLIDYYLNSLAIPSEIYNLLTVKTNELMEFIESNSNDKIRSREERFALYPLKMIEFLSLFQFAIYPMRFTFFSQLIPSGIKEKGFIFKNDLELQRLEPINQTFPDGPARFCYWAVDSLGRACFNVSLLNSLRQPKSACLFKIPILITLEQVWANDFFILLGKLIDSFGNESLTESEESEFQNITNEKFTPPDECLLMDKSPSEMFDAFLLHYPHLDMLLKEHSQLFQKDLNLVKGALYHFILSFRSIYKKSFYLVLCNDQFHTKIKLFEKEQIQIINLEKIYNKIDVHFEEIYYKFNQIDGIILEQTFKFNFENNNFVVRLSRESNKSWIEIDLGIYEENTNTYKTISVSYENFLNIQHFLKLMNWQLKVVTKE
ncbi:MAG: hypothetical protein H0V82_10220 [Candidatus Protochlamydia sp.]|nr:hypothetical protein [Candidatus Protochlamydia sp.]